MSVGKGNNQEQGLRSGVQTGRAERNQGKAGLEMENVMYEHIQISMFYISERLSSLYTTRRACQANKYARND
jgi:hypothetical protein